MIDDDLDLYGRLAELSRREAELQALYATAGDLSSLRDVEEVLRAIVRRVRELVHTDTGYIIMIDEERQDTYVRAWDGITYPPFINGRLGLGCGLAGLVASSGDPHHTADYLADRRFNHTVDDLVSGEGLVAIQGVPLKLRDKVIGVLLAADRRARPFTAQEVALLGSLADHAAIAIENASLFQEVRSTVDQLRRANAAIEAAAELHDRLTELVLAGGGLTEIAETVARSLDGALVVIDPQGKVLAGTGRCSPAVRDALTRRRSTALPPDQCVTPIVAGGELLGALVLTGPEPDEFVVRALERAALVTALQQLNERSMAEAEHRLRGEILDDLLTARDPDGLRRRATLVGLDLDAPHTVLVAGGRDPAVRRRLLDSAAVLATRENGVAGVFGGRVVVLLPGPAEAAPAESAAASFAAHLSERTGAKISVGAAPAGPGALVEAHRDAVRCLDLLLALDRDGEGSTLAGLGVYGLLFAQMPPEELARFVHRTLGPVLDYDTERDAELLHTLETYYRHDGNMARTAAALYVHINTLYQRLDRISTLLGGPSWKQGDRSLQIHLALRLHATTPT